MNDEQAQPGAAENESGADIPAFAQFLRDMGVRAIDHLATRMSEAKKGPERKAMPKPARKIAQHWLNLTPAEKSEFLGRVIATAETIAAAAPAAIVALRERKKKVTKSTQKGKARTSASGKKATTTRRKPKATPVES